MIVAHVEHDLAVDDSRRLSVRIVSVGYRKLDAVESEKKFKKCFLSSNSFINEVITS